MPSPSYIQQLLLQTLYNAVTQALDANAARKSAFDPERMTYVPAPDHENAHIYHSLLQPAAYPMCAQ